MAETLDGDLAFVFIAVGPAEADYAIRVASAKSINYRQRDEGITPGAIEMKRNLVMIDTRFVEIDIGRIINQGRHRGGEVISQRRNGRRTRSSCQPRFRS